MLRRDDLMNGYFILQDPEMFCFGMDAVLLAHYPQLRDGEQVMDLGCGFAPVPLILHAEARKCGRHIHLAGLELQERAAAIADRSVRENGLAGEISIIQGDLREVGALCPPASFSLVTCNPPYQARGEGLVSGSAARALARTELGCTLEDVVKAAAYLLKVRGRLAMVHRPGRLPEILACLRQHHLEPKRMRLVYPRAETEADLVLLESVKGGRAGLRIEPPLIVREDSGEYTKEIYGIYGWDTVSGGDAHRES